MILNEGEKNISLSDDLLGMDDWENVALNLFM